MSVRLNSHLSDKQVTMLRDKLLAEAERIRTNFQLKKSEYENSSISGAKVDFPQWYKKHHPKHQFKHSGYGSKRCFVFIECFLRGNIFR
jgi:hypothetical protein